MKKIFHRRFPRFFSCMCLAAVVVICFLSFTAIAVATETPIAGGSGGTSYSLSCGSDKALVGIKGKAGSFIDRVIAVCARINDDGSWLGSVSEAIGPRGTTDFAGGLGGNSFNLTCPSGYAVSGIKGKAGAYIDQLKVRCSRLGQNGRFSILGDFLNGTAGGTGGSSFGPYDCINNKPARLIRGKASTWVDSMGLGCEYVNTVKIISMSIGDVLKEGDSYSAAVKMSPSLGPTEVADITVNLTSNNRPADVVTVLSGVEKRLKEDGLEILRSIKASRAGCSTITASYKGSSVSKSVLVRKTAWHLQLETPTVAFVGKAFEIRVDTSEPYDRGRDRVITLENIDNAAMQIPDSVKIPAGYSGAIAHVTVTSPGCVRIRAKDVDDSVINAVWVVQQG